MMQRKATKYQKFLNLANVFLLITSTILIFSASILIKFYHISKLDFWSSLFWIVPEFMIVLGIYTFLITVYGFLISGSENRCLIGVLAALLGVAFILQLASIFTALELRTTITKADIGSAAVREDLDKYNLDSATTAKWDILQRDLHCCGGNNFLTGYRDYKNTQIGANNSVPDSCCHSVTEGCGRDIFTKVDSQIRNIIFVDGCLTVLRSKLEEDVTPMMIIYACIGVLLAITELITVVLCCAYIAQITRKLKREENMFRPANASEEHDPLDHETVC
jgi:hypothetical protein